MKKFIIFASIALLSCRSIDSGHAPSSQIKAEQTGAQAYRTMLSSAGDYQSMANTDANGESFVKFSHFFGVPAPDPLSNSIYFQNTSKFIFHAEFLSTQLERYKKILNYEDLILPSLSAENGSSAKEITAGALYYKPASEGVAESLGYEIYFRTDRAATGAQKTRIDVAEVARFDRRLKELVTFLPATSIAFILPQKSDLPNFKSKLEAQGVKTLRGWDFHKTPITATAYSAATSYGYLKAISNEEFAAGSYSDRDILIFKSVPLDIGPVAGLITEQAQVAHSHVIFRAVNQKIPDIFIPAASTVSAVQKNLGQLVKFVVQADGSYTVSSLSDEPRIEAEAEAYWSARKPIVNVPAADLSKVAVRNWVKEGVSRDLIQSYGAKGVNFAILDGALRKAGVDRKLYDSSFLVPFSFYDKHLNASIRPQDCTSAAKKCEKDAKAPCREALAICTKSSTLRSYIDGVITADNRQLMNKDTAYRRKFLFFTQRLIRAVTLSDEILKPLQTSLAAYPNTRRMRFRSSTNAEDLLGLNGAGLYESKSSCLGDADDANDGDGKPSACRTASEVERIHSQVQKLRALPDPDGAIKIIADDLEEDATKKYPLKDTVRSVYASLWTEKAFLNREFYGIDHSKIFMGMLVHPSFIDETANGVAVIYFKADNSVELNIVSQIQDVSITNPIFPGAIPEQITLVQDASGTLGPLKTISKSSLNPSDTPVMSEAKIKELSRQLIVAAEALKNVHGGDRYDVEFMLSADGAVLIKQGRPL